MFERFTDRGRRVVVLAQEESRLLHHDRIGTEHLLLALLHDIDIGQTGRALQRAGVTLVAARRYVEQGQSRDKKAASGHIPFTPRAKKVLELSLRVSQRLGGDTIGEPHLLRAMLDVPDSAACRLLDGFGVDTEALARVADVLALDAQADAGSGTPVALGYLSPVAGTRRSRGRYRPDSQSRDRLVDELAGQREALGTAIRRFGRHDESCEPERECSCGFQLVLDNLDPPPAPGSVRHCE